jgi:hypothetical protein
VPGEQVAAVRGHPGNRRQQVFGCRVRADPGEQQQLAAPGHAHVATCAGRAAPPADRDDPRDANVPFRAGRGPLVRAGRGPLGPEGMTHRAPWRPGSRIGVAHADNDHRLGWRLTDRADFDAEAWRCAVQPDVVPDDEVQRASSGGCYLLHDDVARTRDEARALPRPATLVPPRSRGDPGAVVQDPQVAVRNTPVAGVCPIRCPFRAEPDGEGRVEAARVVLGPPAGQQGKRLLRLTSQEQVTYGVQPSGQQRRRASRRRLHRVRPGQCVVVDDDGLVVRVAEDQCAMPAVSHAERVGPGPRRGVVMVTACGRVEGFGRPHAVLGVRHASQPWSLGRRTGFPVRWCRGRRGRRRWGHRWWSARSGRRTRRRH